MHPRRFARVRPTGRISDVGKLIVGAKAPVIDCRVVDYSAGGACLEIPGQTAVPTRFELLFGVLAEQGVEVVTHWRRPLEQRFVQQGGHIGE